MKHKKYIQAVALVLFVGIAGLMYCIGSRGQSETKQDVLSLATDALDKEDAESTQKKPDENKEPSPTVIYVHICGEVVSSGVYSLPEGSRVNDLVLLAGGFTKKASRDTINLAELLTDSQQIYIPSKSERKNNQQALNESMKDKSETTKDSLVNINSAEMEELMTLTGIGQAKAKSIIQYREEKGPFQTIEDIKNITGIKDGVYNNIKDFISV